MEKRRLTYFLSDFHLGARYFDSPLDNERRVVAFLDSIKDSAKEIYLLGDILDYWYEYRYVVPRGFTRFFGKIAELSDLGVKIYWFIGNHDIWIFDYLPSELGITVVMVLHDLNLAIRYCDRFLFLKDAGVYAYGGQEVMTPENIEAVYRIHVHIMSYMGIPQIIPFPDIRL